MTQALCTYSKQFKAYICDNPGSGCSFFGPNGSKCQSSAEFFDDCFDQHFRCMNKKACLYAEEGNIFL